MAKADPTVCALELQRKLSVDRLQMTLPMIVNYLHLLEMAFDNEEKLVIDNPTNFIFDARKLTEGLLEAIGDL